MKYFFKIIALPIFLAFNVSRADSSKITSLHDAIKFNDVKAVEQLIGAMNTNSKDYAEKTALLHLAIKCVIASINFIKPVANVNPQINSKDDAGKMPLHYAAQHNSVAVAQWLTEHGADVNAEDTEGYTPLHYAASRFDGMKMAELLVENKANIFAYNNVHWFTPFELANDYKNKEVAHYLLYKARWKCFKSGKLLTVDGQKCGEFEWPEDGQARKLYFRVYVGWPIDD